MTDFLDDPFFCVPRTVRDTSEGTVDLPILYYDASLLLAFFFCDSGKVADKIPGRKFRTGLNLGQKSLVVLACFQYRDTSIGPYNEVGLAIPVLWRGGRPPFFTWLEPVRSVFTRRLGYFVVDLPVTTAIAHAAGREIWGYPKFITRIDFEASSRDFTCGVHDDTGGGTIMDLSGKIGPGIPAPPLSLVNYDHLDGRDLRTLVHGRGMGTLRTRGSLRLSVGESSHRMARNLRDLGLDGAAPALVYRANHYQCMLNEGAPIQTDSPG